MIKLPGHLKIHGFLILLLEMAIFSNSAHGDDWIRLLDLRGQWKFEIGDNPQWAQSNFDDRNWEEIFVPSSWEDEGFPGYDGYAWYRKRFSLTPNLQGKIIYLHLGYIDDVDQIFLNGHFIGFSGRFPPEYFTAYHVNRIYILPVEYLNFSGENVIAVRVFDEQLEGGIVRGQVGLFEQKNPLTPNIPLAGLWQFSIGDDMTWKESEFNDSNWRPLLVPLNWETQGYPDYDGFAWYRKTFRLSRQFEDQNLILLLGKIDDLDETYLNGERIGRTGRIYQNRSRISIRGDEWLELRAYYIPREHLKFDGENVLAVRVYDGLIGGGIYDGPIGIITQKRYKEWVRKYGRKSGSIWDIFY